MRWVALVLLGCLYVSAGEPPIGILTLPEVFGLRDPCNVRSGARVLVYETPGGPVLGRIEVTAAPVLKERGRCEAAQVSFRPVNGERFDFAPVGELKSGVPAALAREERGAWVRIALKEGSGWVRNTYPRQLISMLELLRRNEPRLTEDWDEIVYDAPAGKPIRVDILKREEGDPLPDVRVQVLSQYNTQGRIWLHLIFLSMPSAERKSLIQRREGWIAAYGRNGMPALWYSPRGR